MNRKHQTDREVVRDTYAKLASEYDKRWSFYVRATTDATVGRLPLSLGDTLDVGCGTGALLTRLMSVSPDSNFTGVDASVEMLGVARARLPAEVTLNQCWAEELAFDDCSFDTVISCNMFHYIRRPDTALAEMMRVLRPNGALVITDWCDDYVTCKLCDLYLRWFDASHYRMYGVSQCRERLRAAGAQNITIEKYKITWLWGLMTAIAHKPSGRTAPVSSLPLQHAT